MLGAASASMRCCCCCFSASLAARGGCSSMSSPSLPASARLVACSSASRSLATPGSCSPAMTEAAVAVGGCLPLLPLAWPPRPPAAFTQFRIFVAYSCTGANGQISGNTHDSGNVDGAASALAVPTCVSSISCKIKLDIAAWRSEA